jgi:sporulation protein YlmC with PRC-barrel domain
MDVQREDEVVMHETEQLQIPIGAEVSCIDGLCGKSTHVLVNPITHKVTHLVVRENTLQHSEYMVSINSVDAASPDVILLTCTQDELHDMKQFVQTQYVEVPIPLTSLVWPYAGSVMTPVPVEQEQIPPNELAVRRETSVEATDGAVGYVDELLVDPGTGNITHLVVRYGRLWEQKDVAIPISAIDHLTDDTVVLRLNKQEIAALPSIPTRWPPIHLP